MKLRKYIFLLFLFSHLLINAQKNPTCLKGDYFFYREIMSGGANLNEVGINDNKLSKEYKERNFEYYAFIITRCTKEIVVDSVIIDTEKYNATLQKVKSPFKITSAIGDIELVKKTNKKLYRILLYKTKSTNKRIEFNQAIQVFGKIKNKSFTIKANAERLQPLVAQ